MKKILSLLLCSIFLLNSSFINIKAESTEISCNPCVAIEGEDYIDPDWISVANGNAGTQIQPYATTRNLFITNLYQNDYSNVMQSCGLTIASAGCALTSFTMVANYLNGTNYTPAQVNSKLGSNACPLYWDAAASAYNIKKVANKTSGLTTSYVNSELVTQINNSVPVIVGMRLANGSSHYVVVKGYSISGSTTTFNIADPNKYSGKTTLNAYLSSGATVTQLVIYASY